MKKWLLSLVAAVALASPAAAQRSIVPGELTRGNLAAGDPRADDGAYYDEWIFQGRRGEVVIVAMDARDFDAYLLIGINRRGAFQEVNSDDDGGNGTNARLEVRLPEDGVYVIRATSIGSDTGAYTLTLTGGRVAYGGGDRNGQQQGGQGAYGQNGQGGYREARGGPITPGRYAGRLASPDPTLDNGGFFHVYRYNGRRGEQLTLTLRSNDFDAYLVIGTPGGRHGVQSALARDDDGAGGNDSRIVFTLPNDGEYAIRVQPMLAASGRYTLDVESSLRGGYNNGGNNNGGYNNGNNNGGYDEDDPYADEEDAFDPALAGRWGVTPPGARVMADDWSSISARATLGILTIDEDGAYTWRRNGRVIRGQLVPYTPRREPEPGARYFSINDGRLEYYVYLADFRGRVTLRMYTRATDAIYATGYRDNATAR